VADLALASDVSEDIIKGIEAGQGSSLVDPGDDSADKLRHALERAGVVFFLENEASHGGGPGLRLRLAIADEGLRPEELTSENDG
jgi:hypothetical protein